MNDRAKISYVDVVVAFGTLVAIGAVAPWIYNIINMGQSQADPLTSALLALAVPLLLISMLLSMGVSARAG